MNVGMQEQVLSPGVQDADHADLGAQVFRIGCDLQQGLRAGGEQQIVEQTRVLQSQHVEFVRHGEHDVEIAGVQEFAFPRRQPALARLRLALGAVPVSARVVGDGLMTASRTSIAMAAERSGAAAQNGAKSFELLKAEARSIPIQEAIALRAKDVGHLEGGPSHSLFFRLKLRLMFSVLERSRPSSGLLTACKCRLRQMQILGSGLQISVPEQNLDGAQVGARFQQVGRPTVAQRVRSNAFADAGMTRGLATCDPDGFVGNRLIQPAGHEYEWGTGRASASAIASTPAVFPAGPG